MKFVNLFLIAGILAGTAAHADSTMRRTFYTNLSKKQVSRMSQGDQRIFQSDLDFQTLQAAKVCEMQKYPRVISFKPVAFATVRRLGSRFESFARLYADLSPTITIENLFVLKVVCEKTVESDGGSDRDRTPRPDQPSERPATESASERTPEPVPAAPTVEPKPAQPAPTEASVPPAERMESESAR